MRAFRVAYTTNFWSASLSLIAAIWYQPRIYQQFQEIFFFGVGTLELLHTKISYVTIKILLWLTEWTNKQNLIHDQASIIQLGTHSSVRKVFFLHVYIVLSCYVTSCSIYNLEHDGFFDCHSIYAKNLNPDTINQLIVCITPFERIWLTG